MTRCVANAATGAARQVVNLRWVPAQRACRLLPASPEEELQHQTPVLVPSILYAALLRVAFLCADTVALLVAA